MTGAVAGSIQVKEKPKPEEPKPEEPKPPVEVKKPEVPATTNSTKPAKDQSKELDSSLQEALARALANKKKKKE